MEGSRKMTNSNRRAVIFALDGLKADIFRRYAFQNEGKGPANSFLRRLARKPEEGGYNHISVEKTKSIFPTYTLPAWAAIFTGNYPRKNGIVGNCAYYRDVDANREYDSDSPLEAMKLFGWDLNKAALPEILCQALLPIIPHGIIALFDAFEDAKVWIYNPACWTLHPGWPKPWPHKESLIDYYDSGGVQNGDLLTPTLYDYAKQYGLTNFVVHNFYVRSMTQASSWKKVYDGNIKNIDKTWGRASYKAIRKWRLSKPKDARHMDHKAKVKATQYIRRNNIPNILTVYMFAIDDETHAFHSYGNSHDEVQLSGLAFMDREISQFVTDLQAADPQGYQDTLFFLIADHGQTENDTSRKIDRKIEFPGEKEPGDLYRIKTNSYMAHLYMKSRKKWSNIPSLTQIEAFMNNTLPFATFRHKTRRLIDHIEFFVTRHRKVYRNWNGNSWEIIPLSALDDRTYGFVDGARRIKALLHRKRAGDIIMVPKRNDRTGKNTGFSGSKSTHGSLWPEDTYVPFYVWGEPLNDALKESGPVRLKEGNIVDFTPTVMSYFGIYNSHAKEIDGKAIFDHNFNINLKDFEKLEETPWEAILTNLEDFEKLEGTPWEAILGLTLD
jgi:arylsulfatase A-like enzyme